MKIQENLVWEKHSGELIGFVDLGDINVNFATLKNTQTLATHVLVFLVKSVVSPLSYSFAKFATDGITAYQIMPIFWQAVKYLEKNKSSKKYLHQRNEIYILLCRCSLFNENC